MAKNNKPQTPPSPDNDELANAIWDDPALLDALKEFDEQSEPAPTIIPITAKSNKSTAYWPMAAAASLVLSLCLWVYYPDNEVISVPVATERYHQMLTTGVAEQSTIELIDGSVLNLNANSQLSVEIDEHARFVSLESGEAYFDIASNKSKPFIVETGVGQVEVVGTAFNLDKTRFGLTLKVFEGSVKVSTKSQPSQYLSAGEALQIVNDEIILLPTFSPNVEVSWKNHVLSFDNQPLGYVVEKLNGHLKDKVFLDPTLRERSVTGSLNLDDIDGAVELLSTLYQLDVVEYKGSRYLTHKS